MLFREFIQKFQKNIGDNKELLSIIYFFCESQPRVVQSWLDGKYFPRGKYLIKFREIFVGAGVSFDDFNSLSPALKKISSLVAHNYIKPVEDYEKFGFSSRDEFFRPLTTSRKLSPERISRIEKILKAHEKDLNDIQEYRANKFSNIGKIFNNGFVQQKAQTIEEILNGLRGIEYLMKILSPEIENLDQGSPDGRTKFRENYGPDRFFNLSNLAHKFSKKLEGLCGEIAHKKIKMEEVNE